MKIKAIAPFFRVRITCIMLILEKLKVTNYP